MVGCKLSVGPAFPRPPSESPVSVPSSRRARRRPPARRSGAGALALAALLLSAAAPGAALAAEPSVERAPQPWALTRRAVLLQPSADSSEHRVELGLRFVVLEAGWLSLPLASAGLRVEALRLDGRPASWSMGAEGPVFIAKLPPGAYSLVVEGVAAGGPRGLELGLGLEAPSSLQVLGEGLSVEVEGGATPAGAGRWDLGPAPRLALRWSEAVAPPPRPMELRAELMLALRADELGVEGRAELGLVVAHGRLDRLRLDIPSATELELLGPDGQPLRGGGRRVEGGAGSFTLVFEPPIEGSAALSLRYRAPVPGPLAVAAPLPTVVGARALSGWLSMSQEDGLMLAPQAQGGLEAAALAARPERARGLLPGATIAAWRITGPRPALRWADLGAATLQGPPLIIDQADYRLATAEHGRLAMRATWQVRNDRQQFLRVRVPEGWSPLGARVAGRPVAPVRVDALTYLIPLERSVETFSGLVAVPVELNLVGQEEAWLRRGWRALSSPAVDAPVASARWRIDLPPSRRLRSLEGTPRPPGAPAGRLDLGYALRRAEPVAAEPAGLDAQRLRSQETWNQAYSAYKANDFEGADALLREAAALDPSNAAAKDLQGNVDLLLGRASVSADDRDKVNVARKVKAMAWAKADDSRAAQASDLKAAAAASSAGDLRAAVSAYRSAAEQTRRLAQLEQDEAVEEKERLAQLEQTVKELEAALADRDSQPADGSLSLLERFERIDAERVDPPAERKPPPQAPPTRTLSPVQVDDLAGSSSNENTYMLDGVNITDPVRSLPVGRPPPAPAPAPAPAPVAAATGERLKALGYQVDVDDAEAIAGDLELGVEGGVMGGVVGGVLGGVFGGAGSGGSGAGPVEDLDGAGGGEGPPAAEPEEQERAEKTVDRVMLESIPAGRSYQASIAQVVVERRRVVRFGRRGARARSAAPSAAAAPAAPPLSPPPPAPGVDFAPETPWWAAPAAAPPVAGVPGAPRLRSPPSPAPVDGRSATPMRPPQPPPIPPTRRRPQRAALPLPVPEGVEAMTLTLSMPDPPAPLELQQQLVAADEPLRVRLRVAPRR